MIWSFIFLILVYFKVAAVLAWVMYRLTFGRNKSLYWKLFGICLVWPFYLFKMIK